MDDSIVKAIKSSFTAPDALGVSDNNVVDGLLAIAAAIQVHTDIVLCFQPSSGFLVFQFYVLVVLLLFIIFPQRIPLPVRREKDAAEIRMIPEANSEQIEYLALMPVRCSPDFLKCHSHTLPCRNR